MAKTKPDPYAELAGKAPPEPPAEEKAQEKVEEPKKEIDHEAPTLVAQSPYKADADADLVKTLELLERIHAGNLIVTYAFRLQNDVRDCIALLKVKVCA